MKQNGFIIYHHLCALLAQYPMDVLTERKKNNGFKCDWHLGESHRFYLEVISGSVRYPIQVIKKMICFGFLPRTTFQYVLFWPVARCNSDNPITLLLSLCIFILIICLHFLDYLGVSDCTLGCPSMSHYA